MKKDKANEAVYERNSMIDRINTLETTLNKKDETIKKLRNTVEFANNICDGYGVFTDTLMSSIEEKNSEIKVLSDQVTRLMDQLKEAMEGNSGCDICGNTDCEHRVETETKPKTNFDKIMRDMHQKLSPAKLTDMIDKYDCRDARCNECPFNIIAAPYNLTLCNMSRAASIEWLGEDIKED